MNKARVSSQIILGVIMVTFLSSCLMIPDGDSTCTDGGPRNADWPYCAPSEPGGPGPADDPIDPSGY